MVPFGFSHFQHIPTPSRSIEPSVHPPTDKFGSGFGAQPALPPKARSTYAQMLTNGTVTHGGGHPGPPQP